MINTDGQLDKLHLTHLRDKPLGMPGRECPGWAEVRRLPSYGQRGVAVPSTCGPNKPFLPYLLFF